MPILKTFCIWMILCSFLFSLHAQDSTANSVEVTYAQKIGITAPLRYLAPMSSTSEERRKQAKLTKHFIPNFLARGRRPDPRQVWDITQEVIRLSYMTKRRSAGF